jgi:phage FluMu protein Com
MTISLICPECSGNLRIADNLVGKKIKCPKCSAVFAVPAPEEAITAEIPPEEPEDLADEELSRPRRTTRDIRRDPADETVSTIIPYKNAKALIAYYLGVFSFIPCAGNFLGPAALILGILGLRYAKAYPTAKGTGHAIAGIIMGSLTTLAYWGLTLAIMVMGGISALTK